MEKYKILISDPISETGIEELKRNPQIQVDLKTGLSEEELCKIIPEYHGLIVRSQTKVTPKVIAKADKLIAIGRAGVGIDNINLQAASQKGIIVINTPGGNTISTAEHAFALMLSMARRIPEAHSSILSGKWERKKFLGTELNQKTLCVLGVGRIGSEIIKRAQAFNMNVIAYDPFISEQKAKTLHIQIERKLENAIRQADFITLHLPHTEKTHHIIDHKRLDMLKNGCFIINCARGGLIDEKALKKAKESGKIAGFALDVYENEPPGKDFNLIGLEKTCFTPHLGASTAEAQENVGTEIAKLIASTLITGNIVNSVNMPSIDQETSKKISPYIDFAKILGKIVGQLAPPQVDNFRISYSGSLNKLDTTMITRSALVGYLSKIKTDGAINFVNAPSAAEELGLSVSEAKQPAAQDYTDIMELSIWCSSKNNKKVTIAGTHFGDSPRIVKLMKNTLKQYRKDICFFLKTMINPEQLEKLGN